MALCATPLSGQTPGQAVYTVPTAAMFSGPQCARDYYLRSEFGIIPANQIDPISQKFLVNEARFGYSRFFNSTGTYSAFSTDTGLWRNRQRVDRHAADTTRAVERASRLPCRYSYRHSSKNVGKDADVAT